MDVMNTTLISLCLLVVCFLVLERKKYMILCVAIILSGLSGISKEFLYENKFKVHEVGSSYTIYKSQFQKVLAWHTYDGNLDDVVSLSGTLEAPKNSSFTLVKRVSYQLNKPKVRLLQPSTSFRAQLTSKLDEYPNAKRLLLNQSIEGLPVLSSLSLQVSGILIIVNTLLNRTDHEFKSKSLDAMILIVYGILFGFEYSLIRLIISKRLNPEQSGIVMLILFPGTGSSLHFLFPYSLSLLKGLSHRFSALNFKLLVPFLSLLSQNRFHLIEALLYPIFRLVSAVFTLCLIIIPKTAIIIEQLILMLINVLDSSWLKRFAIYGRVTVVLVVLFLYLYAKQRKVTSYFLLAAMLLGLVYPPYSRVVFIDVGQGDATLIQAPLGAYNTLIDTGSARSYNKLKQSLHKYGVNRIDQIIITHDDEDHNGSLDFLIKDFDIGRVIDNVQDVKLLNGLSIDRVYDDTNANSLMMHLKLKNTHFLFTGDAGVEQELLLLKKYPLIQSDFLKLGHHGSNTSSSRKLIQHIQPRFAIASSNPKIYGHPHTDIKKRLYQQRVQLLQTSVDGDIVVHFSLFLDFIHTEAKGFAII